MQMQAMAMSTHTTSEGIWSAMGSRCGISPLCA